jgi:YD repeat-containing protein
LNIIIIAKFLKTVVEEDGTKTHTTTEEYKYDSNGQLVEIITVEEEK